MSSGAGAAKSPSQGGETGEVYQQDGDFIKDIEVNDLRNRYTLTKGSTQKMVNITLFALVADTPASPPLFHTHARYHGFVGIKNNC